MKMKIDLKLEVELPDGTRQWQLSDWWENAQGFAEAARERAASSSRTSGRTSGNSNQGNPFGMFLSEMLDRASEASQRAQDSSVDPEQRPKPG